MIPMIALALAGSTPVGACGVHNMATCADTNALANAPGFQGAVAGFLGPRKAQLVLTNGTVAKQAAIVLGGPPDSPHRIGPYLRFTACQAHDCSSKGALVASPSGAIVAVAILHSTCHLPRSAKDCYAHDILSIYVHGKAPAVIADLKSWAEQAITSDGQTPGLATTHLDRTDIIAV